MSFGCLLGRASCHLSSEIINGFLSPRRSAQRTLFQGNVGLWHVFSTFRGCTCLRTNTKNSLWKEIANFLLLIAQLFCQKVNDRAVKYFNEFQMERLLASMRNRLSSVEQDARYIFTIDFVIADGQQMFLWLNIMKCFYLLDEKKEINWFQFKCAASACCGSLET